MNDRAGFDLKGAVARSIFVLGVAVLLICLTPALLQAVWDLMPAILIVAMIVCALRVIVGRLLEQKRVVALPAHR